MKTKLEKIIELFELANFNVFSKYDRYRTRIYIQHKKSKYDYKNLINHRLELKDVNCAIFSDDLIFYYHKLDIRAKNQIGYLTKVILNIWEKDKQSNAARLINILNKLQDLKEKLDCIKQYIQYDKDCEKNKKLMLQQLNMLDNTTKYYKDAYIGDLKKEIKEFLKGSNELDEYLNKFKSTLGENNE